MFLGLRDKRSDVYIKDKRTRKESSPRTTVFPEKASLPEKNWLQARYLSWLSLKYNKKWLYIYIYILLHHCVSINSC